MILPRKSQSQDENTIKKASHCPLDCPPNPRTPREFSSPPSPSRAPHRPSMTSTTGNNKKTSIVVTSTANPSSPSSYKGTDSVNASPTAPLLLRAAAGPGLGLSRDQRPRSPVSSTFAAPPPHMRHCAHLWDTMDNALKREMLRISFQGAERDLQKVKAEAATYVTKLAES